jgi:hypothetical protein
VAGADGNGFKTPAHERDPFCGRRADGRAARLGGSVPTYVMWESAHGQGIALPKRDYREFRSVMALNTSLTQPSRF